MKEGRTLQELAAEVARQKAAKRDFVGPSMGLEMSQDFSGTQEHPVNSLSLGVGKAGRFDINDLAHEQIADRLEIPRRYYDRLRSAAPQLLATNVNHWFTHKPENRMVRTLDNRVRAFLSDRYRPLDNADLAEAVLPALFEHPDLAIQSCEITERRLYLKAINPRVQGEVKPGDIVQAGVLISNSEVGAGSLAIQPMTYRLVCKNGAILADGALRKYHAGKALGNGGAGDGDMLPWERLSDETRQATDKALWLQVRDLAKAALDEAIFGQALGKMRDAAGQKIEAGPTEVVEVTARRFGLQEGEKVSILKALIEGADLSRLGLANAVTAASQGIDNYDRATDLERLGGQILELPPSSWRLLSEAKN
jgi:hypothetical protein